MSKQEGYLRWLARHLTSIPRALKNFAVAILAATSFIQFGVGMYGMLFGVVGVACDTYTSFQFLGLTNIQWGLVTLVSFFLFTHGIYGVEKR